TEDFCAKVLARLDKLDARQAAIEARLAAPGPVTTPMPKAGPETAAPKPASLVAQNCAACHTQGKEARGKDTGAAAPTFFDAAGASLMNDHQIRKAIQAVESLKMPPVDSAQAKAIDADPALGEKLLRELVAMPAVEEKKTTP